MGDDVMIPEPFIHIEAAAPTGAFKLTKRPSDLRLREYGPTQPTGPCRCGHGQDEHFHESGHCMASTPTETWACDCDEYEPS